MWTCLLTISEGRPVDLLNPEDKPHSLIPYSLHSLPEPLNATAYHPSYNLQDPSSTLFLASLRALPIRLLSPFSTSILASYLLVSPTTEQYIAPHSLLFSHDLPNHFFAGSASSVSTFDINRNGEGPLTTARTTSSKWKMGSGNEMGMKGIVSALGTSSQGILAAGTFSRWIGLYDEYGRGGTIGVFETRGVESDENESYWGTGITQAIWSDCGRYLCAVERNSDGVGVWDIRGTGRRIAWLKGRNAKTNQRLGVDKIGTEIWAGGIDGTVRAWEGLGMKEGEIDPEWGFHAHDGTQSHPPDRESRKVTSNPDAISSTTLHHSGTVLATCSGQRHFSAPRLVESVGSASDSDESDGAVSSCSDSASSSSSSAKSSLASFSSSDDPAQGTEWDNSLKIWEL